MKLERLPEYLTIIVTLAVGMFLALYLGASSGGGSSTSWKITIVIVATVVALIMRANIWLLIPIAWPLTGIIPDSPGAIPVRDLMMVYVFVVFLALKALKVVRAKIQYNWLDYMLLGNLLYLALVFIRNPVGTESMGLDRVGGKTYFETLFLFLGFWVIGHVTLSPKLAQKMPLLMIGADLIISSISLVLCHIPFLTPLASALTRLYSGFVSPDSEAVTAMDSVMERDQYLGQSSMGVLNVLYSSYSPVSTFNPLRFWRWFFSILAIIAILKSGFRSVFFQIGLFFIVASYFRDGMGRVLRIGVIGTPLLVLFIVAQGRLFQLPIEMQRTLSFLPGKWDYEAAGDAVGSTEWRHDIWSNVWHSGNKYIENWWWGDGFSLTKTQLREARRLQDSLDQESIKESLTITGCYHSLPLSAIRTVGYVGFGIFTISLFCVAGYSWRLIRHAKGTPYFTLALLVGVPTIISPLPSLIMTGAYENQLLLIIYSVSMLRLVSRSLEQYYLEQKAEPAESKDAFPEFETQHFLQHGIVTSLPQ